MVRINPIDRIGKKYGFVEITGIKYEYRKNKKICIANYKCICGKESETLLHSVINSKNRSCGCKQYEFVSKKNKKHGMSKERIYNIYMGMIYRCENESYHKFERYGGRGISVCEEWRKDFLKFYNWSMENGYNEELTIDRINNDGDYYPENCRWTNQSEQIKNRDFSLINYDFLKKKVKKLNKDTNEIICVYNSLKEAQEETGINNICAVLKSKRKTAGGFKWEYYL